MRAARTREEAGFTLVEVLVTMSLLAIVATIATSGMIDSMRVQRGQVERATQQNEVKVATERVSRDLRGANPIKVAQPNKVQVLINDGTIERTTTYSLNTVAGNTRLVLSETRKTLPSGPTTTRTRVVLDQLVMGGNPVFQYRDAAGTAAATLVTASAGCDAAAACYDPSDVSQVRLHLETKVTGTSRTIGLESVVNVRNEES